MNHPAPVRPPVLDFFARFHAKPDPAGLYRFRIDLLDLEVTRAGHNLLRDPPVVQASAAHRQALEQAARALTIGRRFLLRDQGQPDLSRFWLALLGHRLSVERGLDVQGTAALARVAADRFSLPLKDTEAWPEDVLFRQYTKTVLREEWAYVGLQFRMAYGQIRFRSRRMRAAREN